MTRIGFLAIVALVASVVGCSNGDVGYVTGTVHLDGKPLEGARVTFYPQLNEKDAFSNGGTSIGQTDAEGKYKLMYGRGEDGAKVGKHKVYIETLEEGGGGDYGAGRKEEVPKRYNSETELEVEVKPGNNTIDFLDLTSEGEKEQGRNVDGRY